MSVPGFWDDAGAARGLIDRKNALEAVVEPFEKLAAGVEDAEVMAGLLEAEGHTAGEHPDVANWPGRWRRWKNRSSILSCNR
jgi:hypothetical protein